MFSIGQSSCSGRSKKTDLTSRFFYAQIVLVDGVLQLRGQTQKCWRISLPGRTAARRTASKRPPLRNSHTRLDVQFVLSSSIDSALTNFHTYTRNEQKMLSNLDISTLSEKLSTKYLW